MNDNAFTDAERAHFRRLKLRAWSGGNRTPATPRSGAVRPAGGSGSPPLPTRPSRQLFSKHTPWEEFERERVDLGDRVVRVPEGALFTNGDRAWRREAVGAP